MFEANQVNETIREYMMHNGITTLKRVNMSFGSNLIVKHTHLQTFEKNGLIIGVHTNREMPAETGLGASINQHTNQRPFAIESPTLFVGLKREEEMFTISFTL